MQGQKASDDVAGLCHLAAVDVTATLCHGFTLALHLGRVSMGSARLEAKLPSNVGASIKVKGVVNPRRLGWPIKLQDYLLYLLQSQFRTTMYN